HGAPVGVLGPQWWARTQPSTKQQFPKRRSLQTETRHVLTALRRVDDIRQKSGSHAQLWFQLDRGFDAWQVLQLAHELGLLVTVRSSASRRIRTRAGHGYLHATVAQAPRLGTITVRIPERADRPGREARL